MITGNFVTIPGAVLGLLGISGFTGVSAAVIDANKSNV